MGWKLERVAELQLWSSTQHCVCGRVTWTVLLLVARRGFRSWCMKSAVSACSCGCYLYGTVNILHNIRVLLIMGETRPAYPPPRAPPAGAAAAPLRAPSSRGRFDLRHALRSLFLWSVRARLHTAATAIRGGASRCDRSAVRYIGCACMRS